MHPLVVWIFYIKCRIILAIFNNNVYIVILYLFIYKWWQCQCVTKYTIKVTSHKISEAGKWIDYRDKVDLRDPKMFPLCC